MASFNLADYETVEERLRRFYKDWPTARVITKNRSTKESRARGEWVFEAQIWLPLPDEPERAFDYGKQPGAYLKATGWAFEIDGTAGANKTSAAENAETSAIGRALANAGYSGNKRASREEMAKVARAESVAKADWVPRAEALKAAKDIDGLRLLYTDAVAAKVDEKTLAVIKDFGSALA